MPDKIKELTDLRKVVVLRMGCLHREVGSGSEQYNEKFDPGE